MLDFENTAEGCCVRFSGEFTIFEAAEVFDAFRSLLQKKQDVSFDLSKVLSTDTSVMQSLMFIKCIQKKHGRSLQLVNHSQPVLELMERLGLINWFNDPIVIPQEKNIRHRSGGQS